jgi:hypothetical protein
MIDDLKADSARWDAERRAQTSRNTPGGSLASRDAPGMASRLSSNSPTVQYQMSQTHQSRQHYGPTEGPYQSDPYSRDAGYDGSRYPGTGAPGYTGASGQPYGQQSQGYAPPSGGGYGYQQPPPSQSAQSYAGLSQNGSNFSPMDNQNPYVHTNANMPPRGYGGGDYNRMSSSGAPQQPVYATAAPTQPAYPSPSPYAGQVGTPSGFQSYQNMNPQDATTYGRGK